MCLTSKSLERLREVDDCQIPIADLEIAIHLYRQLWPKLDHTRRYCLNSQIVVAELLEYIGVGHYPQVKRFKGEKGVNYRNALAHMFEKVDTLHQGL